MPTRCKKEKQTPAEDCLDDLCSQLLDIKKQLRAAALNGSSDDGIDLVLWLFDNFIIHARLSRILASEALEGKNGKVYVTGVDPKSGVD